MPTNIRDLRLGASLAGIEPATRCLEGSCSIQLSYRDTVRTGSSNSTDARLGRSSEEAHRSVLECLMATCRVRIVNFQEVLE